MLVVAAGAHPQLLAQHRQGPVASIAVNPRVLHADSRAKYAAAFFTMASSIFVRASSARSLASSICSALTGLLPGPPRRPSRWALIQLCRV